MIPTQLYRVFDASDRLIYIGISRDADRRMGQHNSRNAWAKEFFRMTVETHPTRGAAIDAEAAAILAEQPIYNKEGKRRTHPVVFDAQQEMQKFERWLARDGKDSRP